MIKAYIKERYDGKFQEKDYIKGVWNNGLKINFYSHGFITYKTWGDALLLVDMFIEHHYRSSGYAWKLFDIIKDLARKAGATVIITFSDKIGSNRENGLGAIEAAGFIPLHDLTSTLVYIRGI